MSNADISLKRNFLIAMADARIFTTLNEKIGAQIKGSIFIHAVDGFEALRKIENAPPHVLIVNKELPKLPGYRVVEKILSDNKYENIAVIIVGAIPEDDHFVDHVVTGRVHFLPDWNSDYQLSAVLAKAFNYLTRGEIKDFRLKFLAPGDFLMREGEPGESVFIVKSGELEASVTHNKEKTKVGSISEGEFVGEMAYINHEPRSADVIATTPCELIEIPMGLLDNVLFQKPAWSKALMITLSKRVRLGNARLSG